MPFRGKRVALMGVLAALVETLADERIARRIATHPAMQIHLYRKLLELRAPQPSLVLDPVRWAPYWRKQLDMLQHQVDGFRSYVFGRAAASPPFMSTSVHASTLPPPIPVLPGQVAVTFLFSDGATPEEAEAVFRRVFSAEVRPLLESQREQLREHWARLGARAADGASDPAAIGIGERPARDVYWLRAYLRDGAAPSRIARDWHDLTERWHRSAGGPARGEDLVRRMAHVEWRAARSPRRVSEAPAAAHVVARLSAWLGPDPSEEVPTEVARPA